MIPYGGRRETIDPKEEVRGCVGEVGCVKRMGVFGFQESLEGIVKCGRVFDCLYCSLDFYNTLDLG